MSSRSSLAGRPSRAGVAPVAALPRGLRARISGVGGRVDLLACDADLAHAVSNAGAGASPPRIHVPTVTLPRGTWRAPRRAEPLALGLLILEGILVRRVSYGRSSCGELLGPGDLLRPWFENGEGVMGVRSEWRVIQPTRLALLNGAVGRLCTTHPEVVSELLDRALVRSRRQSLLNAIAATKGVDERVLLLFGHLAERWGRVTGNGIQVALPLTHAAIAELIGTRRPTVTTVLADLRLAGALERNGDVWVLTEAGRVLLDALTQASVD